MEAFYTIQGEGHHTGTPAYFIRLGGCDVGCVWCDVKESWPAEAHPVMKVKGLIKMAVEADTRVVVVTGGEPLMYDLGLLTSQLKKAGKRTHVETSGVHPLSGDWDWICFSPKKFKAPRDDFYQRADELKVVIYHKHDLEWAASHAARMHEGAALYLQPEWSKEQEMLPLIIDYVKRHPQWRISLQTHKYMDIP